MTDPEPQPMTAVEILDWIEGAIGMGFTPENALRAAADYVHSAAVAAVHDEDGEPFRIPDGASRCRLSSCTLPPHPAGTRHLSWRELGGSEEISG